MREFAVELCNGLCNRLRTYLSADYLAKQTGRKLSVVWGSQNHACGARWQDLFSTRIPDLSELPPATHLYDGMDRDLLRRALESAEPTVCARTYRWLAHPHEWSALIPHWRALKPAPVVARAVQAVAVKLTGPTMGIHVRRGDFARYLPERHNARLPSLEHYFEHLDGWNGLYFLATDGGADVEREFHNRYVDRVIVYPKRSLQRDKSEAVQDALVDLYLLQRCAAIVGTQHSSFTGMARLLGAPFVTVVDPSPSSSNSS